MTANGWWAQEDGNLALRSAARPADFAAAAAVTGVSADLAGDGARGLCIGGPVARRREAAGRWRDDAACRETAGVDPVWAWFATGDGPLAETMAHNGIRIERAIEAGRFADLVATAGPGVLPDGQIVVPTRVGALRVTLANARGSIRCPHAGGCAAQC